MGMSTWVNGRTVSFMVEDGKETEKEKEDEELQQ